ncbi:glycosyltransferase [Vibrio sp. STUT-A16]|uniref:glycosyltransferase n=1 Tax=Vibrio sp. STUT-A16 TaxID=2976237 RepID=UPI0022328A48|nr:glycosyltransferase [Vibrio sp. STUT-A16]BDR19498.1 glycosyl transferase [Vibrio sp. STUT-A16]
MDDLAVLIPAYNDSLSLVKTLNSIDEENNNFTVFVVDDGSENPITINEQRYPFQVVVIRYEVNKGIVGALNQGLSEIKSLGKFKFIARLDCADLNIVNRFKIQYEYLQENKNTFLVGSNVEFFNPDSDYSFKTNVPLTHDELKRSRWAKTCFVHPTVFFRVELIDSIGFYPTTYSHTEDLVYFHKAMLNEKCENLSDVLVKCEIRSGGISGKNRHSQLRSGLRYKLDNPCFTDIYWYISIFRTISYLILKRELVDKIKMIFNHS